MAQFFTAEIEPTEQIVEAGSFANATSFLENSSAAGNVQYVLEATTAGDEHQQPIIINGNQLMVLDNNQQQLIAIQSPQFQTQPIYYMETNEALQPLITVNQSIPPATIPQPTKMNSQIPSLKHIEKTRIDSPRVSEQSRAPIFSNQARQRIMPPQQLVANYNNAGGVLQPGVPRLRPPVRPQIGPRYSENQISSIAQYRNFLEGRRPKSATPRMQQRAQNRATIYSQHTRMQPSAALHPQPMPPLVEKKIGRIIQPNPSGKLPDVLKNFVPPPEIKNIISRTSDDEEFQNSVRMFVLLANGEQRLITFTTPKEDCTIQEILEQVGVDILPGTNVAMKATNADGINLVVSVGFDCENDTEVSSTMPDEKLPLIKPRVMTPQPARPKTPELEPEAKKLIPGKMAVCPHCGGLSEYFHKCVRCGTKLPDGVKAMAVTPGTIRGSKANRISINLKSPNAQNARPVNPNGDANKTPQMKRKITKTKSQIPEEPLVVTLSSDDEDDDKKEVSSNKKSSKEPSIEDIQVKATPILTGKDINHACTTMACRTIRIGSYRFTPKDDVFISGKELTIKVPHPRDTSRTETLVIPRGAIIKVLVNFQKLLPVMFYYINTPLAELIRVKLGMTAGSEPYFDPVSHEEAYKRITLLPDQIHETDRWVLQKIYGNPKIMDELSLKEANTILIKTCPKEQTKCIPHIAMSQNSDDCKQLFIYPPEKGGISINTEDYKCLAQDQFLNDVIIDFYLKYLINQLPIEQRDRVHVFSTFFYNRLTTKSSVNQRRLQPSELDASLSPAQKRHLRVKNWTKQVDIFDKDYVIVPINELAHWFLAVICFPHMDGPQTFDGHSLKIEKKEKPKKKSTSSVVQLSDVEQDKDEADGDESDLESEDSEREEIKAAESSQEEQPRKKVPIKQPCILIFDSLSGVSRAKVVATLRDYLKCEYRAKKGTEREFAKEIVRGNCPRVPQQTNYTDCGLYVLQYVESLFEKPIEDYNVPIKSLKKWFDESVVSQKRENISLLIKDLMVEYKKDVNDLPDIQLPTLNGEPIEHPASDHAPEEDEDAEATEEDGDQTGGEMDLNDSSTMTTPIKNVIETETSQSSDSSQASSATEKPLSSRDTMSYLKAKRIVKNKTASGSSGGSGNEEGCHKKIKLHEDDS